MNQENLDYLKKNLTYMGFDDKSLHSSMESQIGQQPKDFTLPVTGEYKRGEASEKVDYVLSFRKSDSTDMYFFNSFKATLKNDDPSKEISRTFYINKGSGFTAKEAFNLLSGRSVNKDMMTKEQKPYNAWVKIDFMEKDENNNFKLKQFSPEYGFDLDKTLQKYPIRELADPELKERIFKSLEKGNTVKVTFEREGKNETMHIEANPQYKSLNVYNESMKKVFTDNGKKAGTEKSKEKNSNEAQTNAQSKGEGEEEKKTGKRKGIGV